MATTAGTVPADAAQAGFGQQPVRSTPQPSTRARSHAVGGQQEKPESAVRFARHGVKGMQRDPSEKRREMELEAESAAWRNETEQRDHSQQEEAEIKDIKSAVAT